MELNITKNMKALEKVQERLDTEEKKTTKKSTRQTHKKVDTRHGYSRESRTTFQ